MFDQELKNQSKDLNDLLKPIKGNEITEQEEENFNDSESLATELSGDSVLYSNGARAARDLKARAKTQQISMTDL